MLRESSNALSEKTRPSNLMFRDIVIRGLSVITYISCSPVVGHNETANSPEDVLWHDPYQDRRGLEWCIIDEVLNEQSIHCILHLRIRYSTKRSAGGKRTKHTVSRRVSIPPQHLLHAPLVSCSLSSPCPVHRHALQCHRARDSRPRKLRVGDTLSI